VTTFTVWKFDDPTGAQHAADILHSAAGDGLVHVIDRAIVSWPEGASKPTVNHTHEGQWAGAGWGALWGLLLGGLFFVPLLGAAAGAAAGGAAKAMEAVGIDKNQFETLKEQVTPGTSALFAVTENGNLDRLGERFHGLHSTLMTSNLTEDESRLLHETFG